MAQSPFHLLAHAWQSGDPRRVADLFSLDAAWVIDGQPQLGRAAIEAQARVILNATPRVHTLIRRAFNDLDEPEWWVVEWAFRTSLDGARWREIEQGLLLHFVNGQIATLRTHNDHRSEREVSADAPLRAEVWPSAIPSRTRNMTRGEIIATQMRHVMGGWARGEADTVIGCHAPGSIIQTSFETVCGHDQLRRSVQAYHDNYGDTEIEIHRIVYSGDYLAIHQTWCCTNRTTGVRAGDQDLNIGVMQDGKLWRWREYYDSRTSAQTLEQTVFGKVTP